MSKTRVAANKFYENRVTERSRREAPALNFSCGAPISNELLEQFPLVRHENAQLSPKVKLLVLVLVLVRMLLLVEHLLDGATHKRVVACRGFAFPAAVSPSALVECVSHIKWASRGMVFGVMNVLAPFFGLAKNRTRPLFRCNCFSVTGVTQCQCSNILNTQYLKSK